MVEIHQCSKASLFLRIRKLPEFPICAFEKMEENTTKTQSLNSLMNHYIRTFEKRDHCAKDEQKQNTFKIPIEHFDILCCISNCSRLFY